MRKRLLFSAERRALPWLLHLLRVSWRCLPATWRYASALHFSDPGQHNLRATVGMTELFSCAMMHIKKRFDAGKRHARDVVGGCRSGRLLDDATPQRLSASNSYCEYSM
jgi:hypothetical protein